MKGKVGPSGCGRLLYFSMKGGEDGSRQLCNHIRRSGIAVVRQPGVSGDMIVIHDGDAYLPLIRCNQIPATLGGKAKFNVENALAAAAVAYGLRIPIETIREGLATFETSFEENPGRLNVYDGLPFRVILDYAHNPHGMEQMADLTRSLRPDHQRVIAVVTGTGDRRDQDIRRLGEITAGMADEITVKETTLLRGRKPGEIPRLVREGLLAAGFSADKITEIDSESEAIVAALKRAQSGDLVIVFCDDRKCCWKHITSFQPDGVGAEQAVPAIEMRDHEPLAGTRGVPTQVATGQVERGDFDQDEEDDTTDAFTDTRAGVVR